MPSSRRFGSRPRMSRTRAYSASDRPCSAITSGVISPMIPSVQRLDQRFEHRPAVGAAGARIGGALGVRHEAEHVAPGPQHARDIGGGAVRVVEITERDAVLILEALQ